VILASRGVSHWNLQTARRPSLLLGDFTRTVFAPNGDILCIGHWSEDLIDWNPTGGFQKTRTSSPSLPWGEPEFACLSPDGALVAATFDREIGLWRRKSLERIARLLGHTDRLSTLAFSTDGKTLASGGTMGSIKLWDVSSGEELLTLEGHAGSVRLMQFSTDGKILATCSDRPDGTSEVFLWRTAEDEMEPAAPGQGRSSHPTH
jgi:WD40 repeat protein